MFVILRGLRSLITMTSNPQLEAAKHPPPVKSVLDNYWSVKAACFSPDVLNGCIPTETQVIPQSSSWTSSAAFRVTEKRENNYSFRVSVRHHPGKSPKVDSVHLDVSSGRNVSFP